MPSDYLTPCDEQLLPLGVGSTIVRTHSDTVLAPADPIHVYFDFVISILAIFFVFKVWLYWAWPLSEPGKPEIF